MPRRSQEDRSRGRTVHEMSDGFKTCNQFQTLRKRRQFSAQNVRFGCEQQTLLQQRVAGHVEHQDVGGGHGQLRGAHRDR